MASQCCSRSRSGPCAADHTTNVLQLLSSLVLCAAVAGHIRQEAPAAGHAPHSTRPAQETQGWAPENARGTWDAVVYACTYTCSHTEILHCKTKLSQSRAEHEAVRGLLRAQSTAQAKDIIFDNDSRRRMQIGINKLADAVGVTLGPRGARPPLEASPIVISHALLSSHPLALLHVIAPRQPSTCKGGALQRCRSVLAARGPDACVQIPPVRLAVIGCGMVIEHAAGSGACSWVRSTRIECRAAQCSACGWVSSMRLGVQHATGFSARVCALHAPPDLAPQAATWCWSSRTGRRRSSTTA